MKNYPLPETVEIVEISNAVKANCITVDSLDKNYKGDRDTPFIPEALMMYWMQEFNYPKEIIQNELNITDFAYERVESFLQECFVDKDFKVKLTLVGNWFRIKNWERNNKHQFTYYNLRLK